jgi:hypothetical protein
MLHVTNGDSAAQTLRKAALGGDVLAWRDMLHEGPLPAGLPLERMSDTRARFLSGLGFGKYKDMRREFGARDTALLSARKTTLWFEHDLYDQLQLIQILAALKSSSAEISLICIDSFPGIEPFHGLGQLNAEQFRSLWPQRKPVSKEQFATADRAWKALTSPSRDALDALLTDDTSALPYIAAAIRRHLEEFPAPADGLSRTERQILTAVANGATRFKDVFQANSKMEESPYMGDTTVQSYIDRLTNCRKPLLTRDPISLTDTGRSVLAGEANHIALNGIDRWLGGVHLTAHQT